MEWNWPVYGDRHSKHASLPMAGDDEWHEIVTSIDANGDFRVVSIDGVIQVDNDDPLAWWEWCFIAGCIAAMLFTFLTVLWGLATWQ